MKQYLSVKEVAKRYGVDPSTIWRWSRKKPAFPDPHKFGPQTIRWKITDLEAWENQ